MAVIRAQSTAIIHLCLMGALVLNVALWMGSHHLSAKWPGVPPVPGKNGAIALGLGDKQFSYRFGALTLQGLGDGGGKVAPLIDYDYQALGDWFNLLYALDPVSNHVSFTAALYFGAVSVPEKAKAVVDFLSIAGNHPELEKWRWLAHGVFIARHKMRDLDLALELARKLSALYFKNPEIMPTWTGQMPAFVLTALNDKQGSKAVIEAILATNKGLEPNEINFMKSYIDEQLQENSPLPYDVLEHGDAYKENRGKFTGEK